MSAKLLKSLNMRRLLGQQRNSTDLYRTSRAWSSDASFPDVDEKKGLGGDADDEFAGSRLIHSGQSGSFSPSPLLPLLPRLLPLLLASFPAPLFSPSGGFAAGVGDGRGARSGLVVRCSFRSGFAHGAFGLMPYRSFCVLLASSGARWPAFLLCASSWWRGQGSCGSGSFFPNKLACLLLSICSVLQGILLPAGLGGEGKKGPCSAAAGSGGRRWWVCCGFPGDVVGAPPECKVLASPGVPWWSSSVSGTLRRVSVSASSVCWWWRWSAFLALLWPAVEARGAAASSLGVRLVGLGGAAPAGIRVELRSWCFGRVRSSSLHSVAWRRMVHAVVYNVWRHLLPGGERYGGVGDD